jgi:hypothetical protein
MCLVSKVETGELGTYLETFLQSVLDRLAAAHSPG